METGSLVNKKSPRPDILQKNPKNLYMLAEARCGQTELNDTIFEVKQILSSLRRAHRDSWPKGMVKDFIISLSYKLNAGEDILLRCQSKLNALVKIHPTFCSDIHQLRENLSTYNKKFIKMRRECKRFLPDTSLNPPTVSTFHHSMNTEEPETSSTGLAVQNPSSPLGQWRDSQNTFIAPEEPDYSGIQEMFMLEEPSNFQLRVRHILRVGRIQNMGRDPTMMGRVLGSSTNKYIRFCADSGTPAAFIPRSVAERNKLEIFPPDPDEASYASASGHPLTVVGQTSMFIKFKTMKTTKSLRALVVAEEGEEVLVDLESLVQWGILPSCFPLPINEDDREVGRKVRNVQTQPPKKLVDVKERAGSWRTSIKFNQIVEEEYETDHEIT